MDRASPVIRTQSRTRTPLHVIESIGYEAALHGWRLEYDQAFPPCQWALERARESGVVFHIACLLFIRGLGYANFGRLTEGLADLHEATRLSEINQERYWLPRLPNTLAWLHAEMFDFDQAFALNRKGIELAQQAAFRKAKLTRGSILPATISFSKPATLWSNCSGRNTTPGRSLVPMGLFRSLAG
jgi:hypothetical protein